VVDGLKGEDLHGAVGLWSFTDEEAYFSKRADYPGCAAESEKRIRGRWFVGDALFQRRWRNASVDGIAPRRKQGDRNMVRPIGEGRAITGTWRNGYVELSFAGEWPKESRQGTPGPVNAFLTGWIDGDSGKGRMRVEGRSDGAWVGKRK